MANTSSRTLRLLSLLQTHRFWAGPELADRLEVSERTLRRDVERLRELGYPVDSVRGVEGGYQLGAGATMPPLTVDEDEAIAMVVALNGAAQLTAGALSEASVSALSKVVQVLPPKLRRRAEALRAVTDDSPFSEAPAVHADVLAAVAQATRDTERIRFTYLARGGQGAGEAVRRHVEPHRLVTVGRRWYLLAYDLDREDWRTFRLDRMADADTRGWRFRPRDDAPDAAEHVQRAISRDAYDHVARVRIEAPKSSVDQQVPPSVGTVTADGPDRCIFEAGGNHLGAMAMHLGALPWEMTVLDPPELRETMREQAARMLRAAGDPVTG